MFLRSVGRIPFELIQPVPRLFRLKRILFLLRLGATEARTIFRSLLRLVLAGFALAELAEVDDLAHDGRL